MQTLEQTKPCGKDCSVSNTKPGAKANEQWCLQVLLTHCSAEATTTEHFLPSRQESKNKIHLFALLSSLLSTVAELILLQCKHTINVASL